MPDFMVIKDGSGLFPASKAAEIEITKLPPETRLRCSVAKPRSGRQHGMAFALFTYLADALKDGPGPDYWEQDRVRRLLLVVTGYADLIPLSDKAAKQWGSRVAVMPRSMRFDAMSADEFTCFLNDAMAYVREQLAPWIRESEHWPQISEIVRAANETVERAEGETA